MDGSPFPDNTNPPALWDEISDDAKWQIFLVIGFLEFWSELSTSQNKHYMSGGRPGDYPDFFSGKERSEEKKAKGLKAEINNGRLAMIGIFGFLSEQVVPGSVPALGGIVQPYDGEIMAPFTTNVIGMP